MKQIKRLGAMAMGLLLVFSFVACKNDTTKDTSEKNASVSQKKENKETKTEESYRFTGSYVNEDETTVVNYTLVLMDDQSATLECHQTQKGKWSSDADGNLQIEIGDAVYTSTHSVKKDDNGNDVDDYSSFDINDHIGEVSYTVNMTYFDTKAGLAGITDEQMIKGYADTVNQLVEKYADRKDGEIVFYGGSNFVKWATLEEDLSEYPIINTSFGGSNDNMRQYYAKKLVYDMNPAIVVYMSSSNDWTKGASVEEVKKKKTELFAEFAQACPDTVFVIMTSTPNPLRYYGDYHAKMMAIDQWTQEYCDSHDNFECMSVLDALSYDNGKTANTAIWQEDSLHLNEAGYQLLASCVRSKLQEVCLKYGISFD